MLADYFVDAMWVAFRQARTGDITAKQGQAEVKVLWQLADDAGLSSEVAQVIINRSEATIGER